ncbi:MAG TPA: RNA polymerase factor sigma-54 [Mariprofundaceae bacterium]|nr:RNA polymerase factor sigma-54 [Mariprofundaceae bacterium]
MQTKLSQKLGQRLALTPQLTQSLKVLAMNAIELDAYLDECLESNPMLEIEAPDTETPAVEAQGDAGGESGEAWREAGDNRWEQLYTPSPAAERDDFANREQNWHQEQSLSESLHEQVDQQPMSEDERVVAHALIDSLDDDGYFRSDPAVLAAELGVSAPTVVDVLEQVVQELEPAGIGARDLSECLLLQLDDDEPSTAMVRRLLLHHADDLFDGDAALAGKLGCGIDDVIRARARMRRLDPFPGHGLRGDQNYYVRPEIVFRRTADGDIQIEIPDYGWRGVRLNEQWQGRQWAGADREFMDHATREAKWLVYALEQRGETLMKVAQCLARRQRSFLEHGVLGLKPLTLQDVAEEVGLHESTISRVTNGKYAETPLGLIEMRRFFSSGLPTRGGGSISVYRVQQRVKALIESEPTGRPISDQDIADRLQAEGIDIARRTVAKYRENLGLPTSSQRRRAIKERLTLQRG